MADESDHPEKTTIVHRPTEVSSLLRRFRKKRNWLQKDLAERCGWPQSKVSRLETGASAPGFDDLEVIAKVCDLPMERLLRARKRAA